MSGGVRADEQLTRGSTLLTGIKLLELFGLVIILARKLTGTRPLKERYPLGYDTVYTDKNVLTFRNNVLPIGTKSKPSKQLARRHTQPEHKLCRTLGFPAGGYEEFYLLRYDAL